MEGAAKSSAAAGNGPSPTAAISSRIPILEKITPVAKFKMAAAGSRGASFATTWSQSEPGELARSTPAAAAKPDTAVSTAIATPFMGETGSQTRVAEDTKGESRGIENGGSASGTETRSFQTPSRSPEQPQAQPLSPQGDSEPGQSPKHDPFEDHFQDAKTGGPFSDRLHVVGVTSFARFLAHAFASTPRRPPPGIYAHHPTILTRWGQEGRTLVLYNAQGRQMSAARIGCPELVFNRRKRLVAPNDEDYLDNVVVDIASESIIPALKELKHRIDGRTTICLMHPGLGLVEQINNEVFLDRDTIDRPNFIIAQSTYSVGKVSKLIYSVQLKRTGTLYVCGISKWDDDPHSTPAAARESLELTRHMIELLSSTSGLKVVQLPLLRFLYVKLPRFVFCSLADTISVVLGCNYSQIRWNSYAQDLWENLYRESVSIIAALPELQPLPHRIEYFMRLSFQRQLRTYLIAQGVNTSPWIRRVRMGNYPPIDYFNGYLVRRARELGLDHKYNSMAVRIVKARANARRAEIRSGVRLGHTPYMSDTDLIGGGQRAPTLEELMEIGEV